MKNAAWGIGLLVGGLLTAVPGLCDGEAVQAGEKADVLKSAQASVRVIKLQTTCPVMGGAIDKNQYVDHDGKRIYICCKGCEAPLKKDPAKYIQKLEAEGITVAKLQTECPVMGGAIDKTLYVEHAGKRIYVCCQGCLAAVTQDPARYIKTLEEAGVVLDPAGQGGKPAELKADTGVRD